MVLDEITQPGASRSSRFSGRADAPLKWIGIVEQKRRFQSDIRAAAYHRCETIALQHAPGVEAGADDALLPPDVAEVKRPVSSQTRDLGAGAGAAGGAIEGLAGAQDKVLA